MLTIGTKRRDCGFREQWYLAFVNYVDTRSGESANKEEIKEALDFLREG